MCVHGDEFSVNFILMRHPSTHWNDLHLCSCSWSAGTALPAARRWPLPQPSPLDMPVAQATELHRLHPHTLLDPAVAQATRTHQSQPGFGDAVAREEAQSLQSPLWKSWRNWETIFYLRVRWKAGWRKWWKELICLPVSRPMLSPLRQSWRMSWLAEDLAGRRYWQKWFQLLIIIS